MDRMNRITSVVKKTSSIVKVNATYPLILLFLFIFNRLDNLVCGALEYMDKLQSTGNAHITSWWVLMSIAIFEVSIMLYASSHDKKYGLWYMTLLSLLYIGGFLDIMYIFNTPFPEMWLDVNFIHYWNIFYIMFGFKWNILTQTAWWITWLLVIYTLYRYLHKRYHIQLIRRVEQNC